MVDVGLTSVSKGSAPTNLPTPVSYLFRQSNMIGLFTSPSSISFPCARRKIVGLVTSYFMTQGERRRE